MAASFRFRMILIASLCSNIYLIKVSKHGNEKSRFSDAMGKYLYYRAMSDDVRKSLSCLCSYSKKYFKKLLKKAIKIIN